MQNIQSSRCVRHLRPVGFRSVQRISEALARVNSFEIPKGIAYIMIPDVGDMNTNPAIVIDVVQQALGWTFDPILDSGNRK
jgi:hypothetical protein